MERHKKIYLNLEYDFFIEKIKRQENFMLLRYGDGERSIILGKYVKAQEGWTSPDGITSLGKAIKDTLQYNDDNIFYGISCPCCDPTAYFWYLQNIVSENITFANLFVNHNYQRFISDFNLLKRDAVVIGNNRGKNNKIGNLNVLKYYSVSDSCQDFWNKEAELLISEIKKDFGDRNNLLYVFSAGPLSEPIMCALYENNPNNCYVDFGSSIDRYIHHKDTRPYTNPKSKFGRRNCWMFANKNLDLNISVVLTTYKKPDALEKQLNAIQSQTIKPKEILLFQDGIDEKYSINFKQNLLDMFDKVYISNCNQGVWKRFDYARKECSFDYVCLFDDDTIPGERWLENCILNMFENEGIYGTVGIIVKNYKKYPYTGFKRIGWHNPYRKKAIVDFVGHSWFLKKEYLDYMFENTEKYQVYKRAAEDMCLSFKAKQHGINTYVPPHPYWDMSLWGSQPKYGYKFGRTSTAISQNEQGCHDMKKALEDYVKDGWKFVYDLERKEINKNIRGANKDRCIIIIKKIIRRLGLQKGKN